MALRPDPEPRPYTRAAAVDPRRPLDERPASPPPGPRVIDLDHVDVAERELASAMRPYLGGRLLREDADILSARRLQASVFRAWGFVSDRDLADDGTLRTEADPWRPFSEYFAALRGETIMATARQITPANGAVLPTMRLEGLSAAGVARLEALPAGAVVEISALARRQRLAGLPDAGTGAGPAAEAGRTRGWRHEGAEDLVGTERDVVGVYVAMWQRSLQRRHQAWLMAVDIEIFERLRATVAGAALQALGPPQRYWGPRVMPAVLWCRELAAAQRGLARAADSPKALAAVLPLLFPPFPAGSG